MPETATSLGDAGGAGESATTARRRIPQPPEADMPLEPTEREAYFRSLSSWIQQAQIYQNISTCFPYYLMSFQGLQSNAPNIPLLNNNYQFQVQLPWQIPLPNNNFPRFAPEPRPQETVTPADGMYPIVWVALSFIVPISNTFLVQSTAAAYTVHFGLWNKCTCLSAGGKGAVDCIRARQVQELKNEPCQVVCYYCTMENALKLELNPTLSRAP